jgi:hypothetical protein
METHPPVNLRPAPQCSGNLASLGRLRFVLPNPFGFLWLNFSLLVLGPHSTVTLFLLTTMLCSVYLTRFGVLQPGSVKPGSVQPGFTCCLLSSQYPCLVCSYFFFEVFRQLVVVVSQ